MSDKDQFFDNKITMSVDEVAKLLHRSPKTIRNMVANRQIPFVRLNGKTIFFRDTLLGWLREMEKVPHGYK